MRREENFQVCFPPGLFCVSYVILGDILKNNGDKSHFFFLNGEFVKREFKSKRIRHLAILSFAGGFCTGSTFSFNVLICVRKHS